MMRLSNLIILSVICTSSFVEILANNCTCINTLEFLPVCGSDGRTYTNPGEIKCYNKCNDADVKLKKREPCDCSDCPITKIYLPVCGSDGNSYINPNAVDCHNRCNYPPIKIDKEEPCKKNDKLLYY